MKCQKVIEETRQILKLLGIDEQRLHLKWISASEGAAFADEVRSFTQRLVQLGSLGLGTMTEEEKQTATPARHETAPAVSEPAQMASA